MFNLLTDTLKTDIMREYRKRRLIVWLAAVCVLQVSFLIFLMPSYLSLLFKEKTLEASQSHTVVTDGQTASTSSVALVQGTQAVLSVLANHLPSGGIDALLVHIVALKGSNISFQDITTNNQNASTSEVTVDGIAATREALLAFVQRLQTDAVFSNVVLPVSSFAKDSNINFSLSMEGNLSHL